MYPYLRNSLSAIFSAPIFIFFSYLDITLESLSRLRKYKQEDEEYTTMCRRIIDGEEEAGKEDYKEACTDYLSKIVYYEAVKKGTFTRSVKVDKWYRTGK